MNFYIRVKRVNDSRLWTLESSIPLALHRTSVLGVCSTPKNIGGCYYPTVKPRSEKLLYYFKDRKRGLFFMCICVLVSMESSEVRKVYLFVEVLFGRVPGGWDFIFNLFFFSKAYDTVPDSYF